MEQTNPNVGKFSLYTGLILIAVSVVFTFILLSMDLLYPTSLKQTIILGVFNLVIASVILFIGIYNFKKSNENFLSIGESIKVSVGAMAVSALIGILFRYILMNYIEPDFVENYLSALEKMFLDMGTQMTDEMIVNQIEDARASLQLTFVNSAKGIGASLFGGLIGGTLFGLILKKKREE